MKIEIIDFGYKKFPLRAHYNDAGADVYVDLKALDFIAVPPNNTVKIPLGFGLKIPDGMAAFVFPRSGLSTRGIVCELPPIDSGYRGEIHAIVTNCSNTQFEIYNGDRIGQLVILPIIIPEFVSEINKTRGDHGFGSTGI